MRAIDARAEWPQPTTATVYGAQVAVLIEQESELSRQVGRPTDVETLLGRLLKAIGGMTDYDVDVALPVVQALPLGRLHAECCGAPCTIRAVYVPLEGLFYDQKLQPLSYQYDQSISFHELVHHVRAVRESHSRESECHRWRDREVEVYALQNRFLYCLGATMRVMNPGKMCSRNQARR